MPVEELYAKHVDFGDPAYPRLQLYVRTESIDISTEEGEIAFDAEGNADAGQ